ncbi:reverse transcriptase domain-containing protein [Tanacetum coccineum]
MVEGVICVSTKDVFFLLIQVELIDLVAKASDLYLYPLVQGLNSLDGTIGKQTDERVDLAKISSINSSSLIDASVGNNTGPVSYTKVLNGEQSRQNVNFHILLAPAGNGADVGISMESVHVVNERINNSVYKFFLGKRVAYPIVENYVKNTWSKYGLVKSMMTTKSLFLFKFSSKDEMDAMLENDSLSVIATKLGTPLMLDSYTSGMCTESWDRSSYARAMVKLRADVELKDTLLVADPEFVYDGYIMSTIRVKYEWTPPRCSSCKVFRHVVDECPKKIVSDVLNNLMTPKQAIRGVPVGSKVGLNVPFKPTKQVYLLVSEKNGASSNGTDEGKSKLDEKAANSDVVSSTYGTSSKAFGSRENDVCLLEDKDFDCYNGYEDQVYDLPDDPSLNPAWSTLTINLMSVV